MTATTIPLPRKMPAALAVGAFLKNTVCAIDGDRAILSPPNGNLDDPAAIAGFEDAVAGMMARPDWSARIVAHDLHPDFHSTRWAMNQDLPTLAVQHHHAHIAAVLAEHGCLEPALGMALDGFGLGPGRQAWGGELLAVTGARYERLGHLALMAQPGGDIAARQPWRMAAAALARMGQGDAIARRFAGQPQAPYLARVIEAQLNCPPTSSAGRLFDAAAGLLGLHPVADFEGQAPMALEALVSRPTVLDKGWRITDGVLDLLPLLEALLDRTPEDGANLFHGTLAAALTDWATQAADNTGIRQVALSGGCLFNKVLRQQMTERLSSLGLSPLLPITVSPGDPGISLGQAWVAAQSLCP
jgi:hydrogenase maturation protein HypF